MFLTASLQPPLLNFSYNYLMKIKIIIGLIALVGLGFAAWKIFFTPKSTVTYETAKADVGTLVKSISSTGTITSGSSAGIVTKVSGIVSQVYVNNGESVTKGQKIATVTLDDYATDRQASAYTDYLKAREAILDAQEAIDKLPGSYSVGEQQVVLKTLAEKRALFTVAESKFKDADARITAASANLTATLRDYEQNSATLVAPAAGTVSDLVLAPGSVVAASSTTSNTTGSTIVSAQTIGKIKSPDSQLMASVSVTEVDVPNIKAGQKATLTLDAFSDKSFTGKVLGVNTSGTVSSGVTSYPVTILMDPISGVDIYPNMAVTADIITAVKTDVLLIPSTAIQTGSSGTFVQVMKNGKPSNVTVTTGLANDSQTEISSGLSAGDEVVTSTVSAASSQAATNLTTSPFSGFGNRNTGSNNRSGNTRIFVGGGPAGF
jgi:RND family efflux transporter MFP subunit